VTLGSVGLKEDRVLGFVTSFSKLWDGTGWSQDRASVDDRDMVGKRVTVNLMMQPSVLATLAGLQKGAARTTGFLARFLICDPVSTMGSRLYTSPERLDAVDAFTRRAAALFEQELPYAEGSRSELAPPVLQLTPDAFEIWRGYYNAVESELAQEGDFIDIPDFASKSAEQAVRLAGCFHVFLGHDPDEAVSAEIMESAKTIALWFLIETLRVTNLRAIPEHITDATALWDWAKTRESFTAGELVREGPYRLRHDKPRRDTALNQLVNHGYLTLARTGKKRTYSINPNAEAS
jgi:hypothetical protein